MACTCSTKLVTTDLNMLKSHVVKNTKQKEEFWGSKVINCNFNQLFPILNTSKRLILIKFTVWCSLSLQTARQSGNLFGMCVRMQAHERLEEVELQAVRNDNVQLVADILDSLDNLPEKDAAVAELAKILQEPHFKVS